MKWRLQEGKRWNNRRAFHAKLFNNTGRRQKPQEQAEGEKKQDPRKYKTFTWEAKCTWESKPTNQTQQNTPGEKRAKPKAQTVTNFMM